MKFSIVSYFPLYAASLPLALGTPIPDGPQEDYEMMLPRQAGNPVSASNFKNCNANVIKLLMDALTDMQSLAQVASDGAGETYYYQSWFGDAGPGSTSNSAIARRYAMLANWLKAPYKDIIYDCDTTNALCSRPTIKAATRKNGGTINLCRGFFQTPTPYLRNLAPPSSEQPSAILDNFVTFGSELLHEMTHAMWGTSDFTISSGEAAYGHKNTLILAQENSTAARSNADNFAFYAMAAYLGSKRTVSWSTDPNNLIQTGTGRDPGGL